MLFSNFKRPIASIFLFSFVLFSYSLRATVEQDTVIMVKPLRVMTGYLKLSPIVLTKTELDQRYKTIIKLTGKADDFSAINNLLPLAENGDISAMYDISDCFNRLKYPQEGSKWFQKAKKRSKFAANNGVTYEQLRLALLYYGCGNYKEAIRYITMILDAGNPITNLCSRENKLRDILTHFAELANRGIPEAMLLFCRDQYNAGNYDVAFNYLITETEGGYKLRHNYLKQNRDKALKYIGLIEKSQCPIARLSVAKFYRGTNARSQGKG